MLNFVILAFLICLLQATVTVIKEIKESYILTAEEKSVAHLAYLDTLTRIQNRRGFDRYINELNKHISNEKYAICSFDLDELKCVNDTYGHSEGDLYIKAFANELKKQVEEDEFCGRMGGDEFLLVVKYDRVKNVLKELCKRIKEKNEKNNLQYKVSYSVGTSVYVNDGQDDIKESLKIADDEMYRIKGSKKRG